MQIHTLAMSALLWAPGATPTVHSKFGGQIFGFDIDQNGTEGVLTESSNLPGGRYLVAVETFDQATGKILKVVRKTETKDGGVTLGVVGAGVGLVEHDRVQNIEVDRRTYPEIAPLDANRYTAHWSPKLTKDDIILGVSRNQGAGINAFMVYHNKGLGGLFVFGSDVGANQSGSLIELHGKGFDICCSPQMSYDSFTNVAVIGASTGAVGGAPPTFALADFATGKVQYFTGLQGPPPYGAGFVNGMAVDSEDGIACTTTELDGEVEFYDLKKQTGFAVLMPGGGGQTLSGSDVEYDPLHKWFFVAQSVSGTGGGTSSIQIFNTKGGFVKSLNGFNFSNRFNVIPTHIALNPGARTGYVDGPDQGVTELQGFSY